MRPLRYITLFLVTAFSVASCDDFLDTQPSDSLSTEFYYNTEAELDFALTGVYDVLGDPSMYENSIFTTLNAASDLSYYRRSGQAVGPQVLNFDASDTEIANMWASLYDGIQRANLLLSNINRPQMDEEKRNTIKGEALFLRGYYHFLLVSNWGDVPLIIEPTTSVNQTDIARTPARDVYAQILKDMEAAEPLVKEITAIGYSGRVSKSAVRGILARVNLYMAGYPLQDVSRYAHALEWAQKVVASSTHSLNPDFQQIFINYAQDKYDIKESIWEVEFWGNRIGNAYIESGRVGNTNGIECSNIEVGYSYGFIGATPRLYKLYEATDARRDWTVAPFRYVGAAANKVNWTANEIYQRHAGKFRREYEVIEKQKNYTPQNFPLLRYADVLLMLAEAENEVNGPTQTAHDMLNAVRGRAGAQLFTEQNGNKIASKEDFREVIQDERARELAFEALRVADLKRWNMYVSEMKAVAAEINSTAPAGFKYSALAGLNVDQRHMLYPIPLRDLALNKKLQQNKGW